MSKRATAGAIAFLIASATGAWAQTNPNLPQGVAPFENFHGGNIDHISLGSGNLYVHIPLLSYPQRGEALTLSYSLQSNNKGWVVIYNSCGNGGTCGYWSPPGCPSTPLPNVMIVDDQAPQVSVNAQGRCGDRTWTYTLKTPDGYTRTLGTAYGSGLNAPACYTPQVKTFRTNDGSGFFYDNSIGLLGLLVDRNGVRYQGTREDTNGNQIGGVTGTNSAGQTTSHIVDTLGRSIPNPIYGAQNISTTDLTGCTGPRPIASAVLWSPLAPNGGTATFKLCYVSISVQTNFQWGVITEYSATATYLQRSMSLL